MIICSCAYAPSYEDSPHQIIYDYIDIDDQLIQWVNLFDYNDTYIYIFSKTCTHCNAIKQEILSYALDHKESFLGIEYTNKIPLCIDINNTIGSTKLENICILGTPTLLKISEHKIELNIAGSSQILNEIFQNG